MATNKDWQIIQATTLYRLLRLREGNVNGMVSVRDLNDIIGEIESSMTEEEISQVEKKIEKYR